MMYSRNKQIIILFLIHISIELIYAQRNVGDGCTQFSGTPGECKLFGNCPKAIEELQQSHTFPKTCGFQGTQAIVCCSKEEKKTPKTGVISKKKCEKYSQYVWSLERSPIPLIGQPPIRRNGCGHKVVTLIIGGEPAKQKEFPHMAAIGYEQDSGEIGWNCGGSLISDQYVLTAAHCLYDPFLEKNASHIRLGIVKISDIRKRQDFTISNLIPYPEYKYPLSYHDIAKLDKPVKMNPHARPACLYTRSEISAQKAIATGWGDTTPEGFSKSDHLLKVVLDFVSQEECNKVYERASKRHLRSGILKDLQICARSSVEEKDTCRGDSGGPLQLYHVGDDVKCMYDIVGITSVGNGCRAKSSVYVRVSNYIKWIEDTVWPGETV